MVVAVGFPTQLGPFTNGTTYYEYFTDHFSALSKQCGIIAGIGCGFGAYCRSPIVASATVALGVTARLVASYVSYRCRPVTTYTAVAPLDLIDQGEEDMKVGNLLNDPRLQGDEPKFVDSVVRFVRTDSMFGRTVYQRELSVSLPRMALAMADRRMQPENACLTYDYIRKYPGICSDFRDDDVAWGTSELVEFRLSVERKRNPPGTLLDCLSWLVTWSVIAALYYLTYLYLRAVLSLYARLVQSAILGVRLLTL